MTSIRFATKGALSLTGFRLSLEDIERQVMVDLAKYQQLYHKKYGKNPEMPLDTENYVKELWDTNVSYENIEQPLGEEVLGFYDSIENKIIADPQVCNNPRRLSFTIAHEAGHISLHSFMYVGGRRSEAQTPVHIERQADSYAAFLLAPTPVILELLRHEGLAIGNRISGPVDVGKCADVFQEKIGLSRQALEIRLRKMGVALLNARYAGST